MLSPERRTSHQHLRVLLDLNREFTSRRHDEAADLTARGLLLQETFDGRDEEGERLAGTGLGLGEAVGETAGSASTKEDEREKRTYTSAPVREVGIVSAWTWVALTHPPLLIPTIVSGDKLRSSKRRSEKVPIRWSPAVLGVRERVGVGPSVSTVMGVSVPLAWAR